MATRGERWAFWLETELDRRGWQRADVAKRSRKKATGRPIIDPSRVSEWLNSNEAPRDPAILSELARILQVRVSVVLNAAGWLPDDELSDAPVGSKQIADVAEAILRDTELIDEAREHLLRQYELLRRLSPASAGEKPAPAMLPPEVDRRQRELRSGDQRRRRLRHEIRGDEPRQEEGESKGGSAAHGGGST